MTGTHLTVLVVCVVAVVIAIVLAAVALRRRGRPRTPLTSSEEPPMNEAARRTPAVVVNPTKFDDVAKVRSSVDAVCREAGWNSPLWLETTVEDTGYGQARQALEAGADLVCALGGDGTVRKVASALVGTEIPLGLLPGGTGNLLARNLDLPLSSIEEALRAALTGTERTIDVGKAYIRLIPEEDSEPDGTPHPHPDEREVEETFLVMGGLGFDAMIMSDAPETLKAKIGPAAYIWSGLRHLRGPRFRASITLDAGTPHAIKARTILFANVSDLLAGITLVPAEADDGYLDALALSPKSITGWLKVAIHVLTRGRRGTSRVRHMRFTQMQLRLREPQEMQLDGDPIGSSRSVDVEIVPASLRVRVPAV